MNPGLRIKMCMVMRVAYSRACVNFPRVDPKPITSALWRVYSSVAYELGSTYPLGAPVIAQEISVFTQMAVGQIVAKSEMVQLTSGMPPQEAKQVMSLGIGLDQATAMHLYRYRQQYRKDFMGLKQQKMTALQSRRNNLANQLVDMASRQARATMSQMERGEGISQTSRPTMST